jgi:type I restriction enzyme S subunit
MSELEWRLGLLREIAQPVGEKWIPTSSDEDVPYVGLEHISPENPKIGEYGRSSDVISMKNQFQTGDTLFGKLRPYLKKVALADLSGICSTDIIPIRANQKVDPLFIYYLLSSAKVIAKAVESSAGNVMPRASWSDLADIEIEIPPLPEQKKIAEILSGIDAIIQKQKRKTITLGHLKGSLIKDITLGTQEEGSRQVTDIGECPADWMATKLGDIAEFANGNSFKSEDWQEKGYPIIRIQNLNGGSEFNYFSGRIDEKWFVPRGSLLFAWSGQRGKSFGPFVWNGQDGVLNQHIFKVTHAQDINKDFLFLLLKMVQLNAERDAHGFKDSFMHVKKSDIVSTSIAIPPVEAQKRLANSYKQVSLQISLEEKKMESLKNLKSSISTDLLSGRKRVTI